MTSKKPMKKPALFSAAEFDASLTRQWQRFGLQSAREMTPYQWWIAVSAAVNEQVAARRADGQLPAVLHFVGRCGQHRHFRAFAGRRHPEQRPSSADRRGTGLFSDQRDVFPQDYCDFRNLEGLRHERGLLSGLTDLD